MATSSFDVTTNANKPSIPKDPDAILDYSEDWTAWLAGDVVLSAIVVFPDPLSTLIQAPGKAIVNDGSIVTVWLTGGRINFTEQATLRITTAAGRVDDRSMFFKIKDR